MKLVAPERLTSSASFICLFILISISLDFNTAFICMSQTSHCFYRYCICFYKYKVRKKSDSYRQIIMSVISVLAEQLSDMSFNSVEYKIYKTKTYQHMCAVQISIFLLLSMGRYLCWRTIYPRGYYPVPNASALTQQFFESTWVHPQYIGGIRVAHLILYCIVRVCVFICIHHRSVSCVRYCLRLCIVNS